MLLLLLLVLLLLLLPLPLLLPLLLLLCWPAGLLTCWPAGCYLLPAGRLCCLLPAASAANYVLELLITHTSGVPHMQIATAEAQRWCSER